MKNAEYLPELSENVKIYVPGSFAPASAVICEPISDKEEVRIYTAKKQEASDKC